MDFIANNWNEIITVINTVGLAIIGIFRSKK